MRSYRIGDLVLALQSGQGITGTKDAMYYALEDGLSVIFDQKWAWNWTGTAGLTFAPVSQADLFTWAIGSTILQCAAAVTIPVDATGRKVKLGLEWYRIIDVGMSNANQIVVDRQINTAEPTGVVLSFVRDEFSVRTTSIRTVELDKIKIDRLSTYFKTQNFFGNYFERDTGYPSAYLPHDSLDLPPPAYPPEVTFVTAHAFRAGRYYYFYTRFDKESGLESKPGPAVLVEADGTHYPRIGYSNPAGNKSENSTYGLRLYRSPVDPDRARSPMFRIQERVAGAVALFDDTNQTVFNLLQFWDGPYCTLEFTPKPDSDRRSINVYHLNNYYYRPWDDASVNLGVENQVMELLRIFIGAVVAMAGRTTPEYRAAIIHFRQQLAYLVSRSRSAGEDDYGPENRHHDIPGSDSTTDWVDALPWRE